MIVITKDGHRYNLGKDVRHGVFKHWHKLNRRIRIEYYKWHRARNLTGNDRIEFIKLIKEFKQNGNS